MKMLSLRRSTVIWVSGSMLIVGCGTQKDDVSKERLAKMAGGTLADVVPVSGKVLVDGTPAQGINLYLFNEEGGQPLRDCRTDKDGKYCWSTNLACDGLEPGSYRLGFTHIPKPKRNDSGVDLLKGKYKNPMKHDFKLTVEAGQPQTDVNYELKAK